MHCHGAHTTVLCHRLLGWRAATAPAAPSGRKPQGLCVRATPGGALLSRDHRPGMDGGGGRCWRPGGAHEGCRAGGSGVRSRAELPVPRESLLPWPHGAVSEPAEGARGPEPCPGAQTVGPPFSPQCAGFVSSASASKPVRACRGDGAARAPVRAAAPVPADSPAHARAPRVSALISQTDCVISSVMTSRAGGRGDRGSGLGASAGGQQAAWTVWPCSCDLCAPAPFRAPTAASAPCGPVTPVAPRGPHCPPWAP